MVNLIKYYETEKEIFYLLSDENQALVTIPKDLNNNIKVFMSFKDKDFKSINEEERKNIINEMKEVKENIKENSIIIDMFALQNNLEDNNAFAFSNELNNIKQVVNTIYNTLLQNGNVKKEDFVKKVELISLDNKYDNFINWLSMQNPNKFNKYDYQQILEKKKSEEELFLQKTQTSIFRKDEIKPIIESLSIGMPQLTNNSNTPVSSQYNNEENINKNFVPKTMTLKPNQNSKNAGFINWTTTLFILTISLIIGIVTSVLILK